jgi:hypothetical protein
LIASRESLESISLTMDMASVENLPRTEVSPSKFVWSCLSRVCLRELRALRPKGWDMQYTDVAVFFLIYSETLVDLTVEDCMVTGGDGRFVLSFLADSASLRYLKLFQLSQNFWRMYFPTTSESSVSLEVHDDWS